jgi:hypothetical protein
MANQQETAAMQQLREKLASWQALVTQMAVAQAAVLQIQAASFVISPTLANDGIFSELSTTKRTRLFKAGSNQARNPCSIYRTAQIFISTATQYKQPQGSTLVEQDTRNILCPFLVHCAYCLHKITANASKTIVVHI